MSELQAALRKELARAARYREDLSLLVVDAPAAPDVLGKVRDSVRLCDSVLPTAEGRVLVILPETPLAGALIVATRLTGALGPSPAAGAPPSVGVATYPSSSVTDADELLRAGQRAMEAARSKGGGILTPPPR